MVNKNKIKAIIFDLNDVVIIDAHWHAITNAALKCNEDRDDFHYRINTKGSRGDLWWKFMTGRIDEKSYWKELDKNIKNLKVLIEMKNQIYSLLIPKNRTVDIISKLKARYKTGLITNFSKEWMRLFKSSERGRDVVNLFDEVINSGEIGLKKPDKRVYSVTLSRLGVESGETIFVDDLERNLITADEVGMKTILYKGVVQLVKDLKKIGVKI